MIEDEIIIDEYEKKFLLWPSLASGVLLGMNNFFLSHIADLGLPAAFIFSLGAIPSGILYHLYQLRKREQA